jgi:Domain of unknown function (DUF4340)
MKVSHTIIAVLILAVLGGAFYYLQKQPTPPAPEEAAKKKLFAFDAGQVEEFTVESPGETAFTVRRAAAAGGPKESAGESAGKSGSESDGKAAAQANASEWKIVAPAEIAPDKSEIDSFVSEIPKLEGTPVEGAAGGAPLKPSEYGLDKPQKTFRFQLRDGKTVSLAIGDKNITGASQYAKLDSSPNIFLIETAKAAVLDKTLFNLRDKRAIPLAVDQAQQIEVEFTVKDGPQAGRKAKFVLAKQQDGNWHLTDPALRTDYGNSNYFVSSLGGATMSAVEEEAPAAIGRYGLKPPAIRLTVKLADGQSANLWVGNKAGDEAAYYAQNSVWPQVFKINQYTYDQFNQQLDNYRNRYLFDFTTTNARRVEIHSSEGDIRLDKRGEDWFRAGTTEAKVEPAKVEAFLNEVHGLRVQQFTSDRPGQLAQYGLNDPWMRVKVTYGENNTEETVVFARHDNRFYAARDGEPSIYEMSPEEPTNLEPKVKDLTS